MMSPVFVIGCVAADLVTEQMVSRSSSCLVCGLFYLGTFIMTVSVMLNMYILTI